MRLHRLALELITRKKYLPLSTAWYCHHCDEKVPSGYVHQREKIRTPERRCVVVRVPFDSGYTPATVQKQLHREPAYPVISQRSAKMQKATSRRKDRSEDWFLQPANTDNIRRSPVMLVTGIFRPPLENFSKVLRIRRVDVR